MYDEAVTNGFAASKRILPDASAALRTRKLPFTSKATEGVVVPTPTFPPNGFMTIYLLVLVLVLPCIYKGNGLEFDKPIANSEFSFLKI